MTTKLIATFLLIGLSAQGQVMEPRYKSEFTKLSMGASQVQFRDFATSPLIYSGTAIYGNFGSYTTRGATITTYGSNYVFGNTFDPYRSASASVNVLNLYYGKLFRVYENFPYGTLHFGGYLEGTGSIRANGSLMNNGRGLELAPAVHSSMMFTRDISRSKEWAWQPVPFLREVRFKERKRSLSFRLNAGVLNGGYRNGYAYGDQSALVNDLVVFDGYVYNPTAGLRFSGECSLTNELPNKNKIEYSYFFQQFALNGYDRFEWMQQGLKLSIYFLTKHKEI